MNHYYSYNQYLKSKYGRKVYKVAVDCGFTCPNRDGKVGYGGCIFCSGMGSGDFAESGTDIVTQFEKGKERLKSKVPGNCLYICYFQSFTNTYAKTEVLRELFTKAINIKDVVALSIGTRPDCLDEEKIKMLSELNKIKPVTIELGLQTSNEKTAEFINRCYKNEVFEKAVRMLKKYGIEVVVHIIIGLPNETEADMLNSVKYACSLGIDGIKLQLLHVLKNTKLAEIDYTPLEMEEYFRILGKCLEIIPKNIVIHRLTGDGNKKILIAPMWSADKHRVLNSLNKYLDENNIVQGKYAE